MVIRKIDSAASLLLFVYRFRKTFGRNVDSALKLSTILDVMKLFGKNETAVRMALSRSVKSGMFRSIRREGGIYYLPAQEGEQFLSMFTDETENYFKRFHLRNSGWDRAWHLVYISDPDSLPAMNRDMSRYLLRYSFGELAKNIWISPYGLPRKTGDLSGTAGLPGEGYNLAVEPGIVFHGNMDIRGDPGEFLEKVYHLKKLVSPYQDFITRYTGTLSELKSLVSSGEPVADATAVPLFYELGSGFFSFAAGDPMLPKEILPDWVGDRAASLMAGLVEILMPCVERYFKSIE